MEEKYLTFYNKFIRHSKTFSDGGVRQTELPFKTGILRLF